jgi:hypothetical protein
MEETKACTKCGTVGVIGKDFRLRKGGSQSWCNACHSQVKADWAKTHPENRRKHSLKQNYNLTEEGYNALFTEQKGACAICKKTEVKLVVDHCHTSGNVRALLCYPCNSFIGKLEIYENQIDAYMQYIQHYRKG